MEECVSKRMKWFYLLLEHSETLVDKSSTSSGNGDLDRRNSGQNSWKRKQGLGFFERDPNNSHPLKITYNQPNSVFYDIICIFTTIIYVTMFSRYLSNNWWFLLHSCCFFSVILFVNIIGTSNNFSSWSIVFLFLPHQFW